MTTARETHLRRRLERIEAEIARRRDDEALTPSELQARYLRGAASSTDAVGNASQRQAAYLRGSNGER